MPLCAFLALALQTRPALKFENADLQAKLAVPFENALKNLLDINTVPFDPKVYNKTGLLTGNRFLRAGGEYDQPWTRDAAINSWNAASLFEPSVARDTLWSVTRPGEYGLPVVQRDNQWWDKVIWIVGAWNHYQVTGDREFLAKAYGVAERLIQEMRSTRYSAENGLYQGPSFFNDGIAGYPAPPAAANDSGSSFVLDHAGTDRIMALSTNCLYVGAYRAAASMAAEMGTPKPEWKEAADKLKAAINRRFWLPKTGLYGYLLHEGKLDESQEGSGLAFAVLFEVADPSRARSVLSKTHIEPFGITDVYPNFPRFSDERPGRHNAIVWPMVQGMWARAATKMRNADAFAKQTELLATLSLKSEGRFFEIYNARTGAVDGGWQNNHSWGSVPDQTWSATAYLNMIVNGLFGFRFEPKGLRFEPLVPKGWNGATLTGVPYRNAILNIAIHGQGVKRSKITLDGKPLKNGLVPGDLKGTHRVEITVR